MKQILAVILALNAIGIPSVAIWTYTIPEVMALELKGGEGGIYTSETFHLPLQINNATMDISLIMNTYLQISCEIRAGEDYIRFHLNNMSVSYHFHYDILKFFGSISSRDVSLTAYVDTDGIVQGMPHVYITYYGLF